jgi:hypothetical protein
MRTTVYEIENGQRSWMWDDRGGTADLRHLEMAFGFLVKCNDQRYYEVEQDGQVVLTIRKQTEEPPTQP